MSHETPFCRQESRFFPPPLENVGPVFKFTFEPLQRDLLVLCFTKFCRLLGNTTRFYFRIYAFKVSEERLVLLLWESYCWYRG